MYNGLAMETKPRVPPFLALICAILAASSASIFISRAQGEVGSLAISAWRLSLATLVILPYTLIKKRAQFRNITRRQVLFMLLSGIFLALHFACWINSLRYTSLASSVILVATSPLWVAIFAPIFLREKITKCIWIGLIISIIGSAIVGLSIGCNWEPGLNCSNLLNGLSGTILWGNLLALLGAIFSASYLMLGRAIRREVDVEIYTSVVYGIAAVILVVLAVSFHEKLVGFSPVNYLWLIALALIPQLIGHSTFNWALKYVPAALVSLSLLGEPIGSILLAYLFLRKSPTVLEIIGGMFILLGVFLASRVEKRVSDQ